MPVANIRGVNINYRIIGESGPFVALITGGRRGHEEFLPLAGKIAAEGFQVLLHDRRNTGASGVVIDAPESATASEEEIWTDDLHALLGHLGALPAYIGGSSSGARTSILFYLRHRDAVKKLLLFRITGGAFAAGRLPQQYYRQFIQAAQQGGMAAVCATEQYRDRIAANPSNRERLMAMKPERYIAIMQRWLDLFEAGAHHTVMGVSEAELNSIAVPTLVMPGNDKTHSSQSGLAAHRMIPGSRLHRLPIEDQDRDLIPIEEWAPLEDEITQAFCEFMRA